MQSGSGFSIRQFLSTGCRIEHSHVVVVALALSPGWIGIVETRPSTLEGGLVANKRFESLDGSLQSIKVTSEKRIDIARPRIWDGIDGPKFSQEGGSKRATSEGPAIDSVVARNEKGSKAREQYADNKNSEI
jgi:hypothetical protein